MNDPQNRPIYRADVGCLEDTDTKATNPKDALGSVKTPLDLVPPAGNYYSAEAMLEGALKYGKYNWRVAGVRASIYYSACLSHLNKWFHGQDYNPVTLVHELGSARACIDILIDAIECDVLGDDRPPPMPPEALEVLRRAPAVQKLLAQYPPERDGAPHQWTIQDAPQRTQQK